MMAWYFYIVECSDTSLYCGITKDIQKRIEEHNAGTGAKYTRSRLPVVLKHLEEFPARGDALRREREVRRWPRGKKLALIVSSSQQSH
jgi:putative endonuclease